MSTNPKNIKLTEFSHGQGCGCKISPKLLDQILKTNKTKFIDPSLIIGNKDKDDAAVYDLGNGTSIISTTDFFMPIVDDPYSFGKIAATNAISDIYAMGGKPIMGISIFGWPINDLSIEVGNAVVEGGRDACHEANISLAGGHSIDSPEPIFGLAVTGTVETKSIKQNSGAKEGDLIYLTKPLGIGVYSTAIKQKKIAKEDLNIAVNQMTKLNSIGQELGKYDFINALTDVTGFGLGGHLIEVCQGSGVNAVINYDSLPVLHNFDAYIKQNCLPGGAKRNLDSYGHLIDFKYEHQKDIICDPQTSGGLLIFIDPSFQKDLELILNNNQLPSAPIGRVTMSKGNLINIQ